MRLRQKFMTLAWLMGAAVAVVCAISYWFASEELESSTDSELRLTALKEATQLNGWLETKRAFGESTSNVLTSLNGNMTLLKSREVLGTVTSDKEILDMAFALEDKYIACYYAGDITGKLDPTTRAWFNNARDLDKAFFTAPYVDVNTNAYIVSIGVPVKANGKFIGATCLDLSLEVLSKQVEAMNYHGEG
ncbi:MAG: PDC sensor domain-containing protein, partial [Selenomonadaceae bacterium]|nr:PDC sensor domain-containing protein [Selenomonadaceae bacterium]